MWQKIEDGLFHDFFALGSGTPPPRKPGDFRTLLYAEFRELNRVGGNSRVKRNTDARTPQSYHPHPHSAPMQLDGHDSHHSDRTSSMVSSCRIEVSSLGVGRRLCEHRQGQSRSSKGSKTPKHAQSSVGNQAWAKPRRGVKIKPLFIFVLKREYVGK